MGSDGTSPRVNVETGEVKQNGSHDFAEGGVHAEEVPNVVAGAYTNSCAGPETTQRFYIDGTAGALVLQDPPNDEIPNVVGPPGIALESMGLDIFSDGAGGNAAWLMSDGSLCTVDIETGATNAVGAVEGAVYDIRDIAILPKM